MDKKTENLIRPEWIELIRLTTPAEMDRAAQRFFTAVQTRRRREMKDPTYRVDRKEFVRQLGVDLANYPGFYIEIGSCEAPEGSTIPAKEVRPILSIQRGQNSAKFYTKKQACRGVYSQDFSRAWVHVDDYEKMLGDTFFQETKEAAEKLEKRNRGVQEKK